MPAPTMTTSYSASPGIPGAELLPPGRVVLVLVTETAWGATCGCRALGLPSSRFKGFKCVKGMVLLCIACRTSIAAPMPRDGHAGAGVSSMCTSMGPQCQI